MTSDKINEKIHNKRKTKEKTKEKTKSKLRISVNSLQPNIIRTICNILNNILQLKLLKGVWYYTIHLLIMFLFAFVILFSTSIIDLLIAIIIVSLDAFAIVCLHECPLTILERKYLGISSCDSRNYILKNLGICYQCDHNYEMQIELLINVWSIIAMKLGFICLFRIFGIKILDYNNLYS